MTDAPFTFTFGQLLTVHEMNVAISLGDDPPALAKFFSGRLHHIEKVLNHQMDPMYLAYAFIYANTRGKT